MGKDFRVGLILGVVLAIVALVWVATRPSLSPEARMRRSSQAGLTTSSLPDDPIAWESIGAKAQQTAQRPEPIDPPGSEPETVPAAPPPQEEPVARQPKADVEASLLDPNLPDLTVYELDEPITTTRFHFVRSGENLSAIARQYYGSPNKWRKILQANQKAIPDPNKIRPGTKLIIPK